MVTNPPLHSDLAIPPGDYLSEVVEELGLSQAELARRMGRPTQVINEIVHGKKAITAETAIQLEHVTGVPAHIWTGLEDEYQLVTAREQENEQLKREGDLVDPEVYRAMTKLGWVAKQSDASSRARELRSYFGVASLEYVSEVKLTRYAFRVARHDKASSLALAAWLRRAEAEASELATAPFDAAGLRQTLKDLRLLTRSHPENSLDQARAWLGQCGVALVLQPHLPKTYANGATFWLSTNKAAIVLSHRGKWADILWFSLFHELGHVVLHSKSEPHVSGYGAALDDASYQQAEREADAFAEEALVPKAEYEALVMGGDYSVETVLSFSGRVGVAPGVVVGRLQHGGFLRHGQLNQVRDRYEFGGILGG